MRAPARPAPRSRRRSRRLMLCYVVHGLLDRGDLLRLLVGDLHAELLLKLHDQLDEIKRVSLEVLPKGGLRRHFALFHTEPVGGYLLDLRPYLLSFHNSSPHDLYDSKWPLRALPP